MCKIQIWTTCTFSVHINWLKNQICVLGSMFRSHARNVNEFQTPRDRGSAAKIEILGFKILVNTKLIWNSWNLASYHVMAPTWSGNKFVPFGAGSDISFSQTRVSHNKHDGFDRECPTFGDETISIASYCFKKILVSIFEIFQGSFGYFYALTGFSMHLCA